MRFDAYLLFYDVSEPRSEEYAQLLVDQMFARTFGDNLSKNIQKFHAWAAKQLRNARK